MKKIILTTILFLLVLPMSVIAEVQTDVEIRTIKYIKTGDTVSVDFSTSFKGVSYASERKAGQTETTGIYMYAFQFEFDESVLEVANVKSENDLFDIGVYKSDGKYYVLAELNGNTNSSFCPNGVSLCIPAGTKIDFRIKDTDKTTTNLKVVEVEGALITYDGSSEFTENNIKTTSKTLNVIHTFEISKGASSNTTQQTPKTESIVEEKKVNITNEIKKETETNVKNKTTTNKTTNTTTNTTKPEIKVDDSADISNKAFNNYLKTLEIDGYKIDFNKHISIYNIDVPVEVKEVKVNAIAESSKATVEIAGADNLEENNKIIITVTAENKEEKKYIINVKRIKEEKKSNGSFFEITDEQKKTALIFAGVIVGIGLLIFIIIRIRDRKIEKGMDKW